MACPRAGCVDPGNRFLLPTWTRDVLRIQEHRLGTVRLEHPALVANALHVLRHIRHAGVLNDQPTIAG